ncbi:MAG: MarR family winged helix-turn-helix transcriptional regulator [Sphingobium sp.]
MEKRPATEANDLITALGYLCMGSRLKRLGEQMQSGVAAILEQQGLDVQPAQLPLLVALEEGGPLTIGTLGMRVGISQPGITRALARLETLGLVAPASSDHSDRRRHPVMLTPTGARLIRDLRSNLFPAVEQAVGALCRHASEDILGAIGEIEEGLHEESLDSRISRAFERTAND